MRVCCLVCGVVIADTSTDLGLVVPDPNRVDEWALCAEHQRFYAEHYIALVGIDTFRSVPPYTPDTVVRTGAFAHIKADKFQALFKVSPDDEQGRLQPMLFCGDELIVELMRARQV